MERRRRTALRSKGNLHYSQSFSKEAAEFADGIILRDHLFPVGPFGDVPLA